MTTTCHALEEELTEILARREDLRAEVREILWRRELSEAEPGDFLREARLAEEIVGLSGRICYLKCMR